MKNSEYENSSSIYSLVMDKFWRCSFLKVLLKFSYKNIRSYYIMGGPKILRKFFLEMSPLVVKTCGKSEFDIFEAKNTSLIQGSLCMEAKSHIFANFRFNIQTFPESGKHFSL